MTETTNSERPQTWRYLTREGREVELVELRASPMPGFVTGTRKDTGEEWTVAVGKLKPVGERRGDAERRSKA